MSDGGSRARARRIAAATARAKARQSVHVVSITTTTTTVNPLTGKKTVVRRVRKFGSPRKNRRHRRERKRALTPRELRLKEMREAKYAQTHLRKIDAENAKRMAEAEKRLQAKVAAAEQRQGRKAQHRQPSYTKRRAVRVK